MQLDHTINRAVTFLKTGQIQASAEELQTLDESLVNEPIRCNLIGLLHLARKAPEKALAWFDRALILDPAFADAWLNKISTLQTLNRLQDAIATCDRALRSGVKHADLFYRQGTLLRESGRLDEAIAALDRVLALRPEHPLALHAGGQILQAGGHVEAALDFYNKALSLKPLFAEALIDRGALLQTLKRLDEAIVDYENAYALQPDNAELLNNRGTALQRLGRFKEALADLDQAILLKPDLAQAWFNKGNIYIQNNEAERALLCFKEALDLNPTYGEAMSSQAVALQAAGRFKEALAAYDATLAFDSGLIHARNNRASLLLLLGQFEEGLEEYEFRWIAGQTPKIELKFAFPEWDGELRSGSHILVFDEQGLGDAVQFVRYMPLMVAAGMQVTFLCRPSLHRLFRTVPLPITLVDTLNDDAHFDSQIALSSLPRAFKTRVETIPSQPAYLRAEEDCVNRFAERIGQQGFRVGLCWRGNQNLDADPSRSIPLSAFAPLMDIPHLRLISLQRHVDHPASTDAGIRIEDYNIDADKEDTFIETAALMQTLDLIITCDTSLAHLAGALGRPVWLLLKNVPDWRWLMDRQDSPWYPSMRLFRRGPREDWRGLVSRMKPELQSISEAQGASTTSP
ncbi:tetratricopeptide repeat protein [Beijerinckia mobilis]|uniref:tetratricopeptide repeat protein n=1 Tax=Beijerinckia mobilis TaxID=231434 RepID=UPI00068979DB|nr:tetratricopeptide repeat protein [Beijerinckia mobilis]